MIMYKYGYVLINEKDTLYRASISLNKKDNPKQKILERHEKLNEKIEKIIYIEEMCFN